MCSVQCVSIDWLISARVGLNSYVRTSEVNRLILAFIGTIWKSETKFCHLSWVADLQAVKEGCLELSWCSSFQGDLLLMVARVKESEAVNQCKLHPFPP